MGEKITFCKGGGCTAKLGAGILSRVLERLPKGKQEIEVQLSAEMPIAGFRYVPNQG